MKESFLKVVGIEPGKDKSSIPFKTVTFQGVNIIQRREALIKGTVVRNFWPAGYTRLVNGVETKFRGDAEYDTLAIGDIYSGEVFHCDTTPYKIREDGPTLRTWKGVVFDGENPLLVAARALARNNDGKGNIGRPLYEDEDTGKQVPFMLPETQPQQVKIVGGGGEEDENEPK